ncbi:MAG: hypothetical protein FJY98_00715 [Candidatus Liptonbacteria bacterium]|nr:hypothetical protein [Candidatus Liptonbacteria bacterium]
MPLAFIYFIERALFRVGDFFRHWYMDASRTMFHWLVSLLESLDRTLALRVTVRRFFEPLYQDWSVVGRILGVVFRSIRSLIAIFLYAGICLIWAIIYIVWVSLPLALLFYGLSGI